jgi:ribosomal protein L22
MVRPVAEALHVAVCQAVALLNRAPEVARCAEGREARDLLRQALVDYADAYMDQPVTEHERAAVARKHQRTCTKADLLEAVKTERHACSIAVWMTLQDALAEGADDKGLDGWMREAEQRVKNRLAHHEPRA